MIGSGISILPSYVLANSINAKNLESEAYKVAEGLEAKINGNPLDGLEELFMEFKMTGDFYDLVNAKIRIRAYLEKDESEPHLYKTRFVIDEFPWWLVWGANVYKIFTNDKTVPNISRPVEYESEMKLENGRFSTKYFRKKPPEEIASIDIQDINVDEYGCFQEIFFNNRKITYIDNVGKRKETLNDNNAEGYLAELWNIIIFGDNELKVANKSELDWGEERHPFTTVEAKIEDTEYSYKDVNLNKKVSLSQPIFETFGSNIFFNFHSSKIRIPYIIHAEEVMHFNDVVVSLNNAAVKYSNQVKNEIT